MTTARLVLWGVALVVAVGVLAVREVAPAELKARGSDSERAALLLEQRFGEQIRGSTGESASGQGVGIAAAVIGALGFALVAAHRSAGAGLAVGCATVVTALCGGGVAVSLGLGPPAGVAAAAAAAGTFLVGLRIQEAEGRSILGPVVSVIFYLGVAVADVPALRSAAAAAAAGTVVGWAAAISLGPVVGRLGGPGGERSRGRDPGWGFGRVARALLLSALVVLAAGAALRPLPLEAADVSAPAGFQIVIQDPEGFRGEGFPPVYDLSHALERQEGVVEVESIATFVPGATAEQAQNFFLSPLGAEPSEGLVAGTGVTRLVLRIGVAPGSQAARVLVERARALSDRTLPDIASALVGGRAATLVDVRGALFAAYWGLALALVPAWLALRLSGRGARAALVAVGLGALAGAACLGFNALLPNTSPPSRLAPGIALTAAAGIAGAVVGAPHKAASARLDRAEGM
ncbi:MAG: hypothetical protein ACR2MC_06400 [Actinomycetota bacterium]